MQNALTMKENYDEQQWLKQWNEASYVQDSERMNILWRESAARRQAARPQGAADAQLMMMTDVYEEDAKKARIALDSVSIVRQKLKQQLNEPKYNAEQKQTIQQAIKNTDTQWLTAYMQEKLAYNKIEKLYQPARPRSGSACDGSDDDSDNDSDDA